MSKVMSKTNEQEEFEKEKAHLDDDLLSLQKELHALHKQNNDILLNNDEQDLLLASTEEKHIELTQNNKEDLELLASEYECLKEKCDHLLLVKQVDYERLQRKRVQYLEMEEESTAVARGIEDMTNALFDEGRKHANVMHHNVVEVKRIRQHMELTFKQELEAMDKNYQSDAFEALNDVQKKDLLANAKLKDEIGLQSIGLANMGVRLIKERMGTDQSKAILKEVELLEQDMRIRNTELRNIGAKSKEELEGITAEMFSMRQKLQILNMKLSAWAHDSDVNAAIDACEQETAQAAHECNVWSQRLVAFQVLQSDIRPVISLTSKEDPEVAITQSLSQSAESRSPSPTGKGKKKMSPKKNKCSDSPGGDVDTSGDDYSIDIFEVNKLMDRDEAFQNSVKQFLGVTSLLLCGKGEASLESNVLLWLLKQVMDTWLKGSLELPPQLKMIQDSALQGLGIMDQETLRQSQPLLPIIEQILSQESLEVRSLGNLGFDGDGNPHCFSESDVLPSVDIGNTIPSIVQLGGGCGTGVDEVSAKEQQSQIEEQLQQHGLGSSLFPDPATPTSAPTSAPGDEEENTWLAGIAEANAMLAMSSDDDGFWDKLASAIAPWGNAGGSSESCSGFMSKSMNWYARID
jgi:hypothetical protein